MQRTLSENRCQFYNILSASHNEIFPNFFQNLFCVSFLTFSEYFSRSEEIVSRKNVTIFKGTSLGDVCGWSSLREESKSNYDDHSYFTVPFFFFVNVFCHSPLKNSSHGLTGLPCLYK